MTWVEAELARRRRGEAPQQSLPGEDPLPHEVYREPPPKRTGTGFFYKSGNEIPPTHPDHGPMHLVPRQEDGSFAAFIIARSRADAASAEPPAIPCANRDFRDSRVARLTDAARSASIICQPDDRIKQIGRMSF